jgi:hypothetical protein
MDGANWAPSRFRVKHSHRAPFNRVSKLVAPCKLLVVEINKQYVLKILDDEEIVSYILNGLDSYYTPLVSSIMSRLESISLNELYAQALGFESRQAMLHETDQQFMSMANSSTRGRGRGRGSSTHGGRFGQTRGCSFSSRGCGRGRSTSSQKRDQPRCQICKKPNHEAVDC